MERSEGDIRVKLEIVEDQEDQMYKAFIRLYDGKRIGLQIYRTARTKEELLKALREMSDWPRWLGEPQNRLIKEILSSL
ncbi:MAG: hypothetical protein ACP5KE_02160 [Candidatus Methanodesulfokora sp.]|jgi:hypothetical protein|nr:MAG: hypothetical protein C0200_06170 [Candidatus Korarchaeota archaeon]